MGFFYRFVADSMISDFSNPESGYLTSYSAMFIFSLGLFFSNFIFNTWLMYKPVIGKAVSFGDYFKIGTPKLHAIGLIGGSIWCIAMELNLITSEKAGFAISYGLGQGATMVSAAWGVFVWKEFASAKKETSKWINSMFVFFVIGLVLLVASRLS